MASKFDNLTNRNFNRLTSSLGRIAQYKSQGRSPAEDARKARETVSSSAVSTARKAYLPGTGFAAQATAPEREQFGAGLTKSEQPAPRIGTMLPQQASGSLAASLRPVEVSGLAQDPGSLVTKLPAMQSMADRVGFPRTGYNPPPGPDAERGSSGSGRWQESVARSREESMRPKEEFGMWTQPGADNSYQTAESEQPSNLNKLLSDPTTFAGQQYIGANDNIMGPQTTTAMQRELGQPATATDLISQNRVHGAQPTAGATQPQPDAELLRLQQEYADAKAKYGSSSKLALMKLAALNAYRNGSAASTTQSQGAANGEEVATSQSGLVRAGSPVTPQGDSTADPIGLNSETGEDTRNDKYSDVYNTILRTGMDGGEYEGDDVSAKFDEVEDGNTRVRLQVGAGVSEFSLNNADEWPPEFRKLLADNGIDPDEAAKYLPYKAAAGYLQETHHLYDETVDPRTGEKVVKHERAALHATESLIVDKSYEIRPDGSIWREDGTNVGYDLQTWLFAANEIASGRASVDDYKSAPFYGDLLDAFTATEKLQGNGGEIVSRETEDDFTSLDEFISQVNADRESGRYHLDADAKVNAMRESRAVDTARNLRAALAGAARSGMSPEQMSGFTAQISQEADSMGRMQEEQVRLQTEAMNMQSDLSLLNQAFQAQMFKAQSAENSDARDDAFRQAMVLQGMQNAQQQRIAEMQSEISALDIALGIGATAAAAIGTIVTYGAASPLLGASIGLLGAGGAAATKLATQQASHDASNPLSQGALRSSMGLNPYEYKK